MAQAIKVTGDVCRSGGSWDLAWPLLGVPDLEEKDHQMLSPAERVAMAALAKERKVLAEVASAARKSKKDGGKEKDDA